MLSKYSITPALLVLLFSATALFAKKEEFPDVSHDGLVKVQKAKYGDVVYVLPEADLSGYDAIILLEPTIAFRKHWKSDFNSSRRTDRITDKDIAKMISSGKELFLSEFKKTLEKKGYPIVEESAANVLLVRPAIVDLNVNAPMVNGGSPWTKVYSESAGDATLYIELFDSQTEQILVRAVDRKRDIGDKGSWRFERTRGSNEMDARAAFRSWAKMLAKGLDRAKEAKEKE